MDQVDLLPTEFAQSAVQVHHEGGVHVLASQLRSFSERARLLVGGDVCASGRRRQGEFHCLLSAQLRADQISLVGAQPQQQQHLVVDGFWAGLRRDLQSLSAVPVEPRCRRRSNLNS